MKIIAKIFFIFILVFCFLDKTEAQYSFQKTIGSINGFTADFGKDVVIDNNGNLYITGYLGYQGGMVIKFDSSGNILWKKLYGTVEGGTGKGLFTHDGNILILCFFNFTNPTVYSRLAFLKIDTAGNVIWFKGAETIPEFMVSKFIENSNGDIFLCGADLITDSISVQHDYAYLIKLDSAANFIWGKHISKQYYSYYNDLYFLNDSTFLACGTIDTTGNTDANINTLLSAFDTSGTPLWSKLYVDTNATGGGFINRLGYSGFLISGFQKVPSIYSKSLFIKLDPNFNVEWMKLNTTNPGGIITSAINDQQNNIIISGSGPDIIKMDTLGNVLWSGGYGWSGFSRVLENVKNWISGGYVLIGEMGADPEIFLVKTDTAGDTPCYNYNTNPPFNALTIQSPLVLNYDVSLFDTSFTFFNIDSVRVAQIKDTMWCAGYTGIDETTTDNKNNLIKIFPNPIHDYAKIQYDQSQINDLLTIEIYNSLGQRKTKIYKYLGQAENLVNLKDIGIGLILFHFLSSSGESWTLKVIKI